MKTIKGPAIFLAQFAGDTAPFNNLDAIGRWAAGLGYKGVQMPSWDARLFDLKKAGTSKTYCDEVAGTLAQVKFIEAVVESSRADGRWVDARLSAQSPA